MTSKPIPPLPPPVTKAHTPKKFGVAPWTGEGQGEKLVIYSASGAGKTTLASMMPGAIFVGLDDGGRKIRNPKTDEPVQRIEGIETFQDVRDALQQLDLWPAESSCVIDTFTVLENLAEPWMFEHIKHEKGGTVTRLEDYGFGKGYTHLFDTMRLVLQDLDALVRRGVNVCLLCQSMAIRKANPGGIDYLYDGPKLSHPYTEKTSVRLHVCEWADTVAKIDYVQTTISDEKRAARTGELVRPGKITGDTTRAIFVHPEPHYFAKSRTLTEPVIAFSAPNDDSLWQYIFGENE